MDCYKQDWYSKLNGSDRFSKYPSFKSLLQPEKYLSDITLSFKMQITSTVIKLVCLHSVQSLKTRNTFFNIVQNMIYEKSILRYCKNSLKPVFFCCMLRA